MFTFAQIFLRYVVFVHMRHCSVLTCMQDANRFHQICSSTRVPTLHQVIPAIESLSSRWEKKSEDADYAIFHSALTCGLDKLTKYYKKFDNTRVYVLSLRKSIMRSSYRPELVYWTSLTPFTVLHPYYKLAYIEQMWGGEEEYQDDLAAGLPGARNWQVYATDIVDKAVSARLRCVHHISTVLTYQS